MADKKDLDFDDLDDLDFDIPDLSLDPENDDRTPVTKLSGGFVEGVKTDLTDKRNLARNLKRSLPESYSTSIDAVDTAADTAGNLYNTLVYETREGVKDVKRVARQALGNNPKIPKWLSDKLTKLLGTEEESSRTLSEEEIREDQVQNTLADIFQTQTERDEEIRHEEKTEQAVKDTIEAKRHETSVDQLFGIRKELNTLVNYQDQVNARWQHKTLELQYRQLFVANDLYKVTESSFKDFKEALQAISKNTSLPEYRKLELTESVGQSLRDRFSGSVQEKITDLGSGFLERASRSVQERFTGKAKQWNDDLSQMAGTVGMAGESGASSLDMLGSMAGGMASDALMKVVTPLVRKAMSEVEGFDEFGRDVETGVENLPRLFNEFTKRYQGTDGVLGFLADAIGSQGLNPSLSVKGVGDSESPAIFDNLTRKSIVEIIPGYLSRIHHELVSVREGLNIAPKDPDDRLTYDLKSRDFSTKSKERDVIKDTIFDKQNLQNVFESMAEIYDNLDISAHVDPDKEDSVRKTITEFLLKEHFDGNAFSLERLTNANEYSDKVDADIREEAVRAIKERYGVHHVEDDLGNSYLRHNQDVESKDNLRAVNKGFNRISQNVVDPRELIQAFLSIGGEEQLRDLGLLTYDNKGNPAVNYDQIFEVMEAGGYGVQDTEERKASFENRRYEMYKSRKVAQENAEIEASQPKPEKGFVARNLDKLTSKAKRKANEINPFETAKEKDESILRASPKGRGYEDLRRYSIQNAKFTPASDRDLYSPILRRDQTVAHGTNENELVTNLRKVTTAQGRNQLKSEVVDSIKGVYEKATNPETLDGLKEKVSSKAKDVESKLQDSEFAKKHKLNEKYQSVKNSIVSNTDKMRHKAEALTYLTYLDPKRKLAKHLRDALMEQLIYDLTAQGEVDIQQLTVLRHYKVQLSKRDKRAIINHIKRSINEGLINPDGLMEHAKAQAKQVSDKATATFGEVKHFATDFSKSDDKLGMLAEKGNTVKSKVTDLAGKATELVSEEKRKTLADKYSVAKKATLAKTAQLKKGVEDLTNKEDQDTTIHQKIQEAIANAAPSLKQQDIKGIMTRLLGGEQNLEEVSKLAEMREMVNAVSNSDVSQPNLPLNKLQSAIREGNKDFSVESNNPVEKLKETPGFKALLLDIFRGQNEENKTAARGHFNLGPLTNRLFNSNASSDSLDSGNVGNIDNVNSLSNTNDTREEIERKVQLLEERNDPTIISVLTDVKSILNGDSEGITQDMKTIVRLMESQTDGADDPQLAVLSRILENVEAIGKMMAKDEESWFNILDIGKKTGRVLGKLGGALGNFYMGSLKMFGGGFSGVGSLLKGTGRLGGNILSKLVNRGHAKTLVDIYTKGRFDRPALTAVGLKNGDYYDSETGKPISAVEDIYQIKGDVYNKDDNTLAVSKLELSKGIYDVTGAAIGDEGLLSKMFSGVGKTISKAFGIMTAPMRFAFGVPKAIFNMGKKFITRVRDVYVKGETTPRLLASVMKNGGYVSAATGRSIYTLDQIDGEIRDRQGNVILSHEDMRRGLVDWKGEPIRFLDRQINRVIGLVKTPFKVAKWGFDKVKNVASWGLEKITNIIGGITGGWGWGESAERIVDVSEEQLEILTEIRDILRDYTEGKRDGDANPMVEILDVLKKTDESQRDDFEEIKDLLEKQVDDRHKWDKDGDGHRDGHWRSLMKKDADFTDEEKGDDDKEEKSESIWSKLFKFALPIAAILGKVLSGFFSKLMGKFGGLLDLLPGGLRARINLPGGGTPGKPGLLRRAVGGIGKGIAWTGKKAWGAAKWTGKGIFAGGKWTAAKAIPWVARSAGFKTAMALGGKALAGAAAVGGGILAAPLLLKAAVVGGVIAGGVYLWRNYGKTPLKEMGVFRMHQYGISEQHEETRAKILWLEDQVIDNISVEGKHYKIEGAPDLSLIAEQFGLSPDDEKQIMDFANWYNGRFLPVLIAHKRALTVIGKGTELTDIDKLSDEDKLAYIKFARNVEAIHSDYPAPYEVRTSPFGSGEVLSITPRDVNLRGENLEQALQIRVSQAEAKKGGSRLATQLVTQETERLNQERENLERRYAQTTDVEEKQTIRDELNRRDLESENLSQEDIARRSLLENQLKEERSAFATSVDARIAGINFKSEGLGRVLEAEEAILVFTMGLTWLDTKKVKTLLDMKDYVLKSVEYHPVEGAIYSGKVEDVFEEFKTQFNIGWNNWIDRRNWMTWFKERFINVVLSYVQAIKLDYKDVDKAVLNSKDNPELLAKMGELLASLTVTIGRKQRSIWELWRSPWNGYELNSSAQSVHRYIHFLYSMVGKSEELEVKGDREATNLGETANTEEKRTISERINENNARLRELRAQQLRENGGAASQSQSLGDNLSSRQSGAIASVWGNGGGGGATAQTPSVDSTAPYETGQSTGPRRTVPRNEGYKNVVGTLLGSGITQPKEQAMALAQLGHESGNFTQLEENLNYSADALLRVFGRYFKTRSEANQFARKPEAIANRTYGGRMGNTAPGDGFKYRGRGFIQLTGKDNYVRATNALGYDYVNNPDLVSDPQHAAMTSLWWWKNREGLRPAAQRGDVRESTLLINGGYNGLQDRISKYQQYLPDAMSGKITNEGVESLNEEGDSQTIEPMEQSATQVTTDVEGTKPPQEVGAVETPEPPKREEPTIREQVLDPVATSARHDSGNSSTQTPVRAAIPLTTGMDNPSGIYEALGRDTTEIAEQRNLDKIRSSVKEQEERAVIQGQYESLNAVKGILERSLTTQQSMDEKLGTMVSLLKAAPSKNDQPGRQDVSDADRGVEEKQRKTSSLGFDPRALSEPVIGVGRRRSV